MLDKIKLRDGSYATRVDEEKYMRCEQIRNYILRSRYERGMSLSMATYKAMCRFHTNETEIRRALIDWKHWFYGMYKRHRPIELFIKDDKERLTKEKIEQNVEKLKENENG